MTITTLLVNNERLDRHAEGIRVACDAKYVRNAGAMNDDNRRQLPSGIQSFRTVREGNFLYVDKTRYVLRAAQDDKFLFLSRPRRFGKSLFLDTLKELYEGSEKLFKGLTIHGQWDWSRRHPVVRIDFAGGDYTNPDSLHATVSRQLERVAGRSATTDLSPAGAPERLYDLILGSASKAGRGVVVLVDEYDKPILDALGESVATANRSYLRGLFGVLKRAEPYIEKSFVTGIAKFPKTSLFSTANQFTDLTLDPRYNAVCGFTDDELDRTFAVETEKIGRDELRRFYNGYSWGDVNESVYNPFGMLQILKAQEIDLLWFDTGTPSHLLTYLGGRGPLEVGQLEGTWANRMQLADFDIERASPAAVLFQAGYLTVKELRKGVGGTRYRLGFPNMEVRAGLGQLIVQESLRDTALADSLGVSLKDALEAGDVEGMMELVRSLYACIPHQAYQGIPEATYVAYVQVAAESVGIDVRSEEASARGRADLVLLGEQHAFVMEFKVGGDDKRHSADTALAQALRKGYADKYAAKYGGNLHVIGVAIDAEKRNVREHAAVRPFMRARNEPLADRRER